MDYPLTKLTTEKRDGYIQYNEAVQQKRDHNHEIGENGYIILKRETN